MIPLVLVFCIEHSLGSPTLVVLDPSRVFVGYQFGMRAYALPSPRRVMQAQTEAGKRTRIGDPRARLLAWARRWPPEMRQRFATFEDETIRRGENPGGVFEIGHSAYAVASDRIVNLGTGEEWKVSKPFSVMHSRSDGTLLLRVGNRLRVTNLNAIEVGRQIAIDATKCISARLTSKGIVAAFADGTVWLSGVGTRSRLLLRRRGTVPTLYGPTDNGVVLIWFHPVTRSFGRIAPSLLETYALRSGKREVFWHGASLRDAAIDPAGRRVALITGDGRFLLKAMR